MSDFSENVKRQVDIVKVIEGYIRLRNAGAQRFKGLCPFHKEKTPSFNVNGGPLQYFYCFGCQETGDVFSFVGKIENVSFPEAVRMVAQKAGIPLPKREFSSPEEAAEARMRGKLLDLHEAAASWFEEQLRGPEGALAREYLAGRGLTPEGIKVFRIGYAPDTFGALRDRLAGMADEATLRASGLFSSKEQGDGSQGPIYDRFRKRVTFPICNESGRVIAFTARTLESGERAGPKYVNSPETPLYHKGEVLFNLDKAKSAIRQAGYALLVEGQMDCISLFLRGIQHVIATSGTAFTEQQVAILRRHTQNVVVNFDPDAAGANAAEKSIGLLTEEGFNLKLITLEGGLDPDRFIRERGVGAYTQAVMAARRQSDYLIERARQLFPGATAEQKLKQMNYLLPHIRRIPEDLLRLEFVRDASQKLGIDSAVMLQDLRHAALKRRERIEARSISLTYTEKVFVRALVATEPENCDLRQQVIEAIEHHPEWFEHLGSFRILEEMSKAPDPMRVVQNSEQRGLLASAIFETTQIPRDSSDSKKEGKRGGFMGAVPLDTRQIRSEIRGLHRLCLERQRKELINQIVEAEKHGDFPKAQSLLQDRLNIERQVLALRDSD